MLSYFARLKIDKNKLDAIFYWVFFAIVLTGTIASVFEDLTHPPPVHLSQPTHVH
jgi:hypothetical protein